MPFVAKTSSSTTGWASGAARSASLRPSSRISSKRRLSPRTARRRSHSSISSCLPSRLKQVGALLRKVCVVVRDHPNVLVPDKLGHRCHGDATLKCIRRERMPIRVAVHALEMRELLSESAKPAADAVSGKRLASPPAAKERARRVFLDQSPGKVKHPRRQVNDPGLSRLLLRLVFRQDPQPQLQIHVLCRNSPNFRRSAAGLLQGEDELPEMPAADRSQDFGTLLR